VIDLHYDEQRKRLKGLSPTMAAGLSGTLWSMTDLAEIVDTTSRSREKRGLCTKSIAA
jgi:hypothetical protein